MIRWNFIVSIDLLPGCHRRSSKRKHVARLSSACSNHISVIFCCPTTARCKQNVLLRNQPNDTKISFREGNHGDDYSRLTYRKLLEEVCRFANVLKMHGVNKGDRVSIYMPMVMELPIAMLACARIGAVHSIVVS